MAASSKGRRNLVGLKTYKPVTPGTRGLVLVSTAGLHRGGPVKSLSKGIKETGGRNNLGRITSRHRGGRAHRRTYRKIDFKRRKWGVSATVERLERDPNRTSFIALIRYDDDELSYIIAPTGIKVGDKVVAGEDADIKVGNALPLVRMPSGTVVHNVEMKPGKGGQIARSAGCYANFAGLVGGYAQIRLGSGELRLVKQECMATVGVVSNGDNSNQKFGKAGRMRYKGIRPSVRGVAMNPVDHPHGGGEGKSSGGRHPVTPHGVPTKGRKTRNNKSTDRYIVRRRGKK